MLAFARQEGVRFCGVVSLHCQFHRLRTISAVIGPALDLPSPLTMRQSQLHSSRENHVRPMVRFDTPRRFGAPPCGYGEYGPGRMCAVNPIGLTVPMVPQEMNMYMVNITYGMNARFHETLYR